MLKLEQGKVFSLEKDLKHKERDLEGLEAKYMHKAEKEVRHAHAHV
jgi:hypothetical protein